MFRSTLQAQHAIRDLPFVSVNDTAPGHPLDFWSVEPTGDRDADLALGEHCAGLALDVARQFEMPLLLAMILRDLTFAGRFTAVEAGFLAGIASAAHIGSHY